MYDFFILFILYTYHYIYCVIIFLAYVNINTFILCQVYFLLIYFIILQLFIHAFLTFSSHLLIYL